MLSKTINYANRNIEYILVIFIMAGIISMNKTFAYIGVHSVYITEFLLVVTLLSLSAKLIHSTTIHTSTSQNLIYFYIKLFWPLILLLIFAVVRLSLDISYGMQAVRHSMILLYTICFVFLFTLSIKNERHLSFIIVYLLIIFSSLFNGIKILIFKYLHITFNYYEQERVFHVETDTICASVAILGLLVFHKEFWNKNKIGFIFLLFLNLSLLLLTVKRSAVLGMVPSFLLYLYFIRESLELKSFFKIVVGIIILLIVSICIFYYLYPDTVLHYWGYFLEKISLKETNTNWRLQAWTKAFEKFKDHLLWGIGYGPNILDFPINHVDTSDPHNSFLAFLVRHGIFISSLYLFLIVRTYFFIFQEINHNPKDSVTRNNAIFICLGLTAMMIFAFFNVVMENQYEGIFFNFFLAGIYIIKFGKLKIASYLNFPYSNNIGYTVCIIFFLFISFAFSPYNHAGKMNLYSKGTNTSVPLLYSGDQKDIRLISNKEKGIAIVSDNAIRIRYAELSWFLPAQSAKEDLSKYHIEIESAGDKRHFMYALQFEDNSRLSLKTITKEKLTEIVLPELASKGKDAPKPKYLIVSLSDVPGNNDIVIKNICLDKN